MMKSAVFLGRVLVLCSCLLGDGLVAIAEEEPASVPGPLADLENRFFEALAGGQTDQAESLLLQSIRDGRLTGEDPGEANLLVALGNQYCETGKVGSACAWLEDAVARYGNVPTDDTGDQTYAKALADKIAWLKAGGIRSWVEKDPVVLGRKLMQALSRSDRKTLEATLVPFDVYLGWWQSELEAVSRDELLTFLETHRTGPLTWANEPELKAQAQKHDQVVYINTRGWKEIDGYANVQFALHAVPTGGWEWRGIVLGEDAPSSAP